MTYASRAVVTHGLSQVSRDPASRQRLSDSVPDTGNKLSEASLACLRCGVRTAMEQVLRSREDGGHIILISASDDANSVSKLDFETVEENIKYYNIRVSSVVLHTGGGLSPQFSALASISGGMTSTVGVSRGAGDVWTQADSTRGLTTAVKVDRVRSALVGEVVHMVDSGHNASVSGTRDTEWTSEVSQCDAPWTLTLAPCIPCHGIFDIIVTMSTMQRINGHQRLETLQSEMNNEHRLKVEDNSYFSVRIRNSTGHL